MDIKISIHNSREGKKSGFKESEKLISVIKTHFTHKSDNLNSLPKAKANMNEALFEVLQRH